MSEKAKKVMFWVFVAEVATFTISFLNPGFRSLAITVVIVGLISSLTYIVVRIKNIFSGR